jgi:Xaa-Pro aminopeptidase
MHQEQRQQTHDLLQKQHIDQAVFAKLETVKWLTGFAVPVQVGPSLFAASYPLVWYDKGQFTLIVVDSFADLLVPFRQEPDMKVITYLGNTVDQPIASGNHLLSQFKMIAKIGRGSKIGVEREYVSDLISEEFHNNEIVAVDGWLEPLRMVKTQEELIKLRRNFALTDIGHATAKEAVIVGKREIDVWTAVHSAIQAAAGCRVPLGNDCVVGYRSPNNIGGWPLDYEIRTNDSIIIDLSTILDGYWSDSCGTYYPGEPTPLQGKLRKVVADALDLGISLVRPGVVAKEIDEKIRKFIADSGYPVYPHHTGHGVGVSGHEAPRIVPYNDEVLQAGMVIMLEPGIYLPGETGVRLEDALLVTEDGAEVLTHHIRK